MSNINFYLGFTQNDVDKIENNCIEVLERFDLGDKQDDFDDYVLQYLEDYKLTDGINAIIESFFLALKQIIMQYRNKDDEDFELFINSGIDSHFCIKNKKGNYIELCNAA